MKFFFNAYEAKAKLYKNYCSRRIEMQANIIYLLMLLLWWKQTHRVAQRIQKKKLSANFHYFLI